MRLLAALFCILLMVPASAKGRKLKVSVDERTELLCSIQLLSGYKWLTQADLSYKKEMQQYFEKHKGHAAVRFYKSFSRHFYGYAPLMFICHYKLPDFQQWAPFNADDKAVLHYDRYRDSLEQFVLLLKDFYKSSGFHRFFKSHKAYYDSISRDILAESRSRDYIGVMENHFGVKNRSYEIILSPLQMDAGFGPMIESKGANILYAIVGPRYDSGTFPEFDRESLFKELVVHEFSHSFCNPLIDSFYSELLRDSCLLDTILQAQQEQGYGDWKACLYEHLTRANEIVLNELLYDKAAADKLLLKMLEEDQWIYLAGLVPLIREEYMMNRWKYKTQWPLMLKVIEYFDTERMKNCR